MIVDLILPEAGASWQKTSMDMLMMALGSVRKHTEGEWRAIVQEAGLKVSGVWNWKKREGGGLAAVEGVVECEVVV